MHVSNADQYSAEPKTNQTKINATHFFIDKMHHFCFLKENPLTAECNNNLVIKQFNWPQSINLIFYLILKKKTIPSEENETDLSSTLPK